MWGDRPQYRAGKLTRLQTVEAGKPDTRRHSANQSLSAVEPVSASPKRKLENGEQRPAPETRAQRTEMPEIADQRLGAPQPNLRECRRFSPHREIIPQRPDLRMAERADRQFPCRGHEFCCPTEGRGDCPHMRVAVEVGKTAHIYTADGKSLEFKWAQR